MQVICSCAVQQNLLPMLYDEICAAYCLNVKIDSIDHERMKLQTINSLVPYPYNSNC